MAAIPKPVFQTITVPVGGTVYVPQGATIIGKSSTGDADISSDCIDVDAPLLECYEVGFISSADANNNTPLSHDNTMLESMSLNGTTYPIGILFKQLDEDSFNSLPKGIITIYDVDVDPDDGGTDKQDGAFLRFKTVPDIADAILFKAVGEGYSHGVYMKPYSIDCPDTNPE